MNMTFKTLAEKFMRDGAARKRKPLRDGSLRAYHSDLNQQLIPFFGDKQVQTIDGEQVKALVAQMAEDGLSGASIKRKISLFKKILRSLRDKNGNLVLTPDWSSEYLDIPETDSKTPTVSAQIVSGAISSMFRSERTIEACLCAILAGTGMRIGEALALKKVPEDDGQSTVWLGVESKIIIRKQITRAGESPTKTKAGVREIDLCAELNNFLYRVFVGPGHGESGLMFECCQDKYRGLFTDNGIKGGFHTLRRFRVTYLRMSGVPQPLVDFWDGHAAATMSERYTQVGGELQARKEWAEKVGLGFTLEGL